MKSIFRKRNPNVQSLFNEAGQASKVMCVALDYAKATHTAIACDGSGRQLRGVFNVENNRAGLDFMLKTVAGLCRKHHINPAHVFFGGEDCGSYAFNFIHALVSRGFLVLGINTKQAKDERESSKASTDLIDTVGVAGMMIKMKGRTIGMPAEQFHGIKYMRRHRRAVLKAHTASAHRLHRIIEQLFPGFLTYDLSGITPFSRASLWLMEDRFSAEQIRARQKPTLVRKLREFSISDPDAAANKLKALAKSGLPPPELIISALQYALHNELAAYRLFDSTLKQLDKDIAKHLAKTPGAMLTTMPGIGLRWAPGLYAELGDLMRRRNVHSMAALGGITPRVKQTGGPGKPAVIGSRSKACSSSLKHVLMSCAVSISRHGHEELRQAYQTDKDFGRDACTRMAQKVLRVSLFIIDHQSFYLPPSLHQGGTRDMICAYYAKMWPKVLLKWRNCGAAAEAVAEGTPLRQWRDMVKELYGLELSLKAPQLERK